VPELDPGPDSMYFWAHQFQLIGGQGGYLGLQTKGDRADGTLGKMAIFSIWDALEAEGAAPDGSGAVRFGGEGTGWSCRIAYHWAAGHAYRLRVETDHPGWWSATVADEHSGVASPIGRIRVPGSWGRLATWSVMWTEYYGRPLRRCADLAHSRATFGTPTADTVDGGRTLAPEHRHDHLSDGDCPAAITEVEGGVRQEMGVPVRAPTAPGASGG
jgi:hypothetical protein